MNFEYDIYPSGILKRINVMLALIIAWSVGKNGLSPKDSKRIKAALLFASMGEAAFALGERIIGVGLFSLCQITLCIRNSAGLKLGLTQGKPVQRKSFLLWSLFIVLLALFIIIQCRLKFIWEFDCLTMFVFLYIVVLSISLWAGVSCYLLKLLPTINSRFSALGIICFYCCDILVGLDAVMEAGYPWLLVNSFIWIFYIPALVMLALSCYGYSIKRSN